MRLFWVFFLLPTLAFAQQDMIHPWQVIDALQWDLDKDGQGAGDRAMLVFEDGEDTDIALAIYTYDAEIHEFELDTYVNDVAWLGSNILQIPYLTLNDENLLEVHSLSAAGRFRWHRIATIIYADGAFKVGKFYIDGYTSPNIEEAAECMVDFVNGEGSLRWPQQDRAVSFTHTMKTIPVSDWQEMDRATHAECAKYE